MPQWFPEPEILRMLYAENWKYEVAYNQILSQLQWRETKLPLVLEDIHSQILKSGFLQYFGRDKFHRPVMYMKPLVVCKLGYASRIDEIVRVICFANFYILNHMHLPGKVENNICIIDLQKCKPWELPIKSLSAF